MSPRYLRRAAVTFDAGSEESPSASLHAPGSDLTRFAIGSSWPGSVHARDVRGKEAVVGREDRRPLYVPTSMKRGACSCPPWSSTRSIGGRCASSAKEKADEYAPAMGASALIHIDLAADHVAALGFTADRSGGTTIPRFHLATSTHDAGIFLMIPWNMWHRFRNCTDIIPESPDSLPRPAAPARLAARGPAPRRPCLRPWRSCPARHRGDRPSRAGRAGAGREAWRDRRR